jgi:hypothetical protein
VSLPFPPPHHHHHQHPPLKHTFPAPNCPLLTPPHPLTPSTSSFCAIHMATTPPPPSTPPLPSPRQCSGVLVRLRLSLSRLAARRAAPFDVQPLVARLELVGAVAGVRASRFGAGHVGKGGAHALCAWGHDHWQVESVIDDIVLARPETPPSPKRPRHA